MAEIALRNICKSFGDVIALSGINLDVKDGEFLTLVGPSGCGKSTLLRIIAGLEQQSEGDVEIDQKVVNHLRASKRDLAMVFQFLCTLSALPMISLMEFRCLKV